MASRTGRPTSPAGPKRRPSGRQPRPDKPRRTKAGSFRRRVLRPSAITGVLMVVGLAVVVAFVATLVYASIDAGRPLESGPTTVALGEGDPLPTIVEPELQTTTTSPPQDLTPEALEAKVTGSVRQLRTLDEEGRAVEGTAFVVGSFGGQTLLLTSLALVRAGTRAPSPTITLGTSQQATLWTWEESRDLALLVVGGANESLPFVNSDESVKQGERISAGRGGKLSVGMVIAASPAGIEHNIFVEEVLQGAPIVNQKGQVVGMASRAYNPSGRGTETQYTAVPIALACERVIRCGGGNVGPAATTTSRPS